MMNNESPLRKGAIITQNPVQDFLKEIILYSYESLPKDVLALIDDVSTSKFIENADTELRQLLREPKPAEYQKCAIKLCLGLQGVTKISAANAKLVIGEFFTLMMEEITKHWNEYGIRRDNVHPDYWLSEELEDPFWKPSTITDSEYESLSRALNYLKTK